MAGKHEMTRRTALGAAAGIAGALMTSKSVATEEDPPPVPLKGRLKQSVCKWCYGGVSLEALAKVSADIGLHGVDLLGPEEWPIVKQFGLTCPMANGPGPIEQGWNDPANHDNLIARSELLLPQVAEAGLPNMIVFSGNRRDLGDREGIKNCARGLKRIMSLAESLEVTVCMELLNSRRDHKDYHCDRTAWGVALVDEVGSDRFKLLYDIYHMQIMEGDICQTITDNINYIGHFHTGGVPGRHEINETQELNYRKICEVIMQSGFEGYLAQEFIPSETDVIGSLREAAHICDV